MCKACEGLGIVQTIDVDSLIDKQKSLNVVFTGTVADLLKDTVSRTAACLRQHIHSEK